MFDGRTADCKSVGESQVGSIPTLPTNPQTTTVHMGFPVEIPRVPNFIFVQGDDVCERQKFSVGQFSDKELRVIGNAWTENLIKRAKEIQNVR